ncbi:P-loop NTPase family protein [Bacilliculturomica massiliensis]|uniref:hypothetical protein n=1 Tax=Bacilliculturomica massiliensis TaxID=1917867 RepID=UPI001031B740|nr:hypothetical protein [Bacilliculturomica massiliensis]
MSKLRVGVFDQDVEYGAALTRQLALKNADFQVALYEPGSHPAGPPDAKEIDVLILGEIEGGVRSGAAARDFSERGRCIVLTGRETELPQMPAHFRYGRVSELASLIRSVCGKRKGDREGILLFGPDTGVRMTGFLSGSGGTGKTVSAIAYARVLSREYGKRVLFLSFEEWDSSAFYAGGKRSEEHRLEEFLYYLFSRREGMDMPRPDVGHYAPPGPETYLYEDPWGVCGFFPSSGLNDLAALSEKELVILFQELICGGRFDRVVLDLPSAVTGEEAVFLIRSCVSLVLVSDSRPYSVFRAGLLERWLTDELNIGEEAVFSLRPETDEESFLPDGKGGVEIDIHHQIGREVKDLAERMGE